MIGLWHFGQALRDGVFTSTILVLSVPYIIFFSLNTLSLGALAIISAIVIQGPFPHFLLLPTCHISKQSKQKYP